MFHRSESSPPEKTEMTLKERAEMAMDQARPLFDAESDDAFAAKIVSDFISGRIKLAEFLDKYDSLRSDGLEPGELEFSSLREMHDFLKELLGDEEVARDLADHEKSHLAVIKKAGWKYKILFRFFRNDAGDLCGRPAVAPTIPESGDEDDIRSKLKMIIEAPDDMSDTDRMSVEK